MSPQSLLPKPTAPTPVPQHRILCSDFVPSGPKLREYNGPTVSQAGHSAVWVIGVTVPQVN